MRYRWAFGLLVTLVAGAAVTSHAEDVRKVHVREVTEVGGVETEISDEIRVTGTEYETSSAPAVDGFIFVGWTASEGTLSARDRHGRARESVRYVPTGVLTLMAHYVAANVDTARDGVPDGLKLYWYGDLTHGAASDTDGDGFTLAQEIAAGTNPLLRDRSVNGGIWRMDGVLCQYNPQGIQPIVVRSEPEGALFATTTNYLAAGEQLTTPAFDGETTAFAHWTVDGVRAADRRGRARNSVTVTATGGRIEVVAVAEADATRRAQLYWYGTSQSLDSDTDGDGFTFAQELKAGTNPLLADRTVVGGVFTGQGDLVAYNVSSARLLTVRSEPEGVLFETVSDYVPVGQPVGTSLVRMSGETFAYWTTNGVRVADRRGRAKESFEFAMPAADVELVAVAVSDELERAQMHWYGSTQSLDSDTDGDGLTFRQELAGGTNPLLVDRTLTGGVYWRDGAEVEVDLQGPAEFVLHFDANGGSGNMAVLSVPAVGGTCALPPNAFERIGYSFVGWAQTPEGETAYHDGGDIQVPDGDKPVHLRLYACWRPNAYVVRFDGNGGEGEMADQPFEYGCAQQLASNRFVRTGYAFAGWATRSEGATGVVLDDGQVVSNLTAEADGVVTLLAQWAPNKYAVGFNPGKGGSGSMPNQPMTYDEEQALCSNLFFRVGYTFLGWTDDENEVAEVLYDDGVVVSNLTDEADGVCDLYAIWVANEYTVRFNANGGKGVMADQAFVYDEPQQLSSNGFVRARGEFLGWSVSPHGKVMYADGDEVCNLTAEADGVVNLYAVWNCEATTWTEDEAFSAAAANVYDGYVVDDDYNLVGVVQVKTAKQVVKTTTDKKTKVTAVTTNITATATVTDASGVKWSYLKGLVTVDGVVTGLKCMKRECPVAEFGVALGKNGMEGEWGDYAIFGARNGMGVKGDAMMDMLGDYKGKWSVTLSCASLASGEDAASPLVVRLQLNVQTKGVVKVAGNWEGGEKASASAQMVLGDGFAYVPVMVKSTKAMPALNALLRIDAGGEVVLLSEGNAGAQVKMELLAGGRTADALGELVYLPSEVSAGGKTFSARVAMNELAYPAQFVAKKLPAGLRIDAATGVISGAPTQPGFYTATVTVTSGANSKVKEIIEIKFEIANYVDPIIRINDAYGPYYVGVAAEEQVDAGEDCVVSGLPSGLKWTAKDVFDSKMKELNAVANTVYGVPTKACTNTVCFKKSAKETVGGKQKTVTHQASATFVVEGMKPWAVGTFNGGSTNGIVTLTVAKTGKISGKWMSEGLAWTLSAASFDAYISSEQMYVATVIGKSGKLVTTNEIAVTESGIVGFVTSGKDSAFPSWEAWRNEWREGPLETLAKELKGLKRQVGEEVSLTVGANGAVTAKGVFTGFDEKKLKPISYPASCSTVLIPTDEPGRYRVYLYFPPKSGTFDGFSACESVTFAP